MEKLGTVWRLHKVSKYDGNRAKKVSNIITIHDFINNDKIASKLEFSRASLIFFVVCCAASLRRSGIVDEVNI